MTLTEFSTALVEGWFVKTSTSGVGHTKFSIWTSSGNVPGSKIGLSIGEKVRWGIDFFCDGEKKSINFAVKDLGVFF